MTRFFLSMLFLVVACGVDTTENTEPGQKAQPTAAVQAEDAAESSVATEGRETPTFDNSDLDDDSMELFEVDGSEEPGYMDFNVLELPEELDAMFGGGGSYCDPWACSRNDNGCYTHNCNDFTGNCDAVPRDEDGDGAASCPGFDHFDPGAYDCRDLDPTVRPGNPEICDDGIDNNCNDDVDKDDLECPEEEPPVGEIECDSDLDCDDGTFCNGQEYCLSGECKPGAPIVCDDGVDCTADSCNESWDHCEFIQIPSACAENQYCSNYGYERGCVDNPYDANWRCENGYDDDEDGLEDCDDPDCADSANCEGPGDVHILLGGVSQMVIDISKMEDRMNAQLFHGEIVPEPGQAVWLERISFVAIGENDGVFTDEDGEADISADILLRDKMNNCTVWQTRFEEKDGEPSVGEWLVAGPADFNDANILTFHDPCLWEEGATHFTVRCHFFNEPLQSNDPDAYALVFGGTGMIELSDNETRETIPGVNILIGEHGMLNPLGQDQHLLVVDNSECTVDDCDERIVRISQSSYGVLTLNLEEREERMNALMFAGEIVPEPDRWVWLTSMSFLGIGDDDGSFTNAFGEPDVSADILLQDRINSCSLWQVYEESHGGPMVGEWLMSGPVEFDETNRLVFRYGSHYEEGASHFTVRCNFFNGPLQSGDPDAYALVFEGAEMIELLEDDTRKTIPSENILVGAAAEGMLNPLGQDYHVLVRRGTGCSSDTECDDLNGCTTDSCSSGECGHMWMTYCEPCETGADCNKIYCAGTSEIRFTGECNAVGQCEQQANDCALTCTVGEGCVELPFGGLSIASSALPAGDTIVRGEECRVVSRHTICASDDEDFVIQQIRYHNYLSGSNERGDDNAIAQLYAWWGDGSSYEPPPAPPSAAVSLGYATFNGLDWSLDKGSCGVVTACVSVGGTAEDGDEIQLNLDASVETGAFIAVGQTTAMAVTHEDLDTYATASMFSVLEHGSITIKTASSTPRPDILIPGESGDSCKWVARHKICAQHEDFEVQMLRYHNYDTPRGEPGSYRVVEQLCVWWEGSDVHCTGENDHVVDLYGLGMVVEEGSCQLVTACVDVRRDAQSGDRIQMNLDASVSTGYGDFSATGQISGATLSEQDVDTRATVPVFTVQNSRPYFSLDTLESPAGTMPTSTQTLVSVFKGNNEDGLEDAGVYQIVLDVFAGNSEPLIDSNWGRCEDLSNVDWVIKSRSGSRLEAEFTSFDCEVVGDGWFRLWANFSTLDIIPAGGENSYKVYVDTSGAVHANDYLLVSVTGVSWVDNPDEWSGGLLLHSGYASSGVPFDSNVLVK